MAIPNGYRLLTSADIGKVFGVDLETTAYVYFENDSVEFPTFWDIDKQLTDFITYNYEGELGGAYISFDSGIVSGADNLWLNGLPPFEYCTVAEGTELTTFNTDADWNTWFYVKDIIEKVIITKSKITNLGDKVRAKTGTSINYTIDAMADAVENLQVGVNEEDIYTSLNEMKFGSGYMLTLNIDSAKVTLNNADFTYSLDSGMTWNQYTSTTMVLEDVTKIMFSWGVGHTAVKVGTTAGGSDIVKCERDIDSDDIILTEDTVWYVSSYYTGVGGGSD